MATEGENPQQSPASAFLGVGKDAVALLRDTSILFLAILLIAFPARLNSILENAGFVEGSIAGFKWQSKLGDSNSALQEAQATISDLQKKNNELSRFLGEANGKVADAGFKERVATLQKENTQLNAATEVVQSSVTRTIASNAPLLQNAGPQPQLSDYLVGLQTLGAADEVRTALNTKIHAAGYGLHDNTVSYPAGDRQPWFAQRSTVFYYAGSALPVAQKLAQLLKDLTGEEFAVQRGNGQGVNPAQRDVTLFVNFIKK